MAIDKTFHITQKEQQIVQNLQQSIKLNKHLTLKFFYKKCNSS